MNPSDAMVSFLDRLVYSDSRFSRVVEPGVVDAGFSPDGDRGGLGFWVSEVSSVVFRNEDDSIRISVVVFRTEEGVDGTGHTWYRKPGTNSWFGFDRRGIEDSFYLKDPSNFEKVMTEQIKRIQKSLARDATLIEVPGIPFRVTPEMLSVQRKSLSEGRSIRFYPGGFGTGYLLSTRKTRYSKPLPEETATFFGVPKVFYETFDHD